MAPDKDRNADEGGGADGTNVREPTSSTAITALEQKAEQLVKWITEKAISGVPPLSSAADLADEYILNPSHNNADERVDSLIKIASRIAARSRQDVLSSRPRDPMVFYPLVGRLNLLEGPSVAPAIWMIPERPLAICFFDLIKRCCRL